MDDTPIVLGNWRPGNYNGRYLGRTTLRKALAHSSNAAAVRTFLHAGSETVIRTARRLGITSKLHGDASLALGTAEMPLIDVTTAYAHFANGGYKVRPHIIRQVRMNSGRIIYARGAPKSGRIIDDRLVGAMNDMLHGVVASGTGRSAALKNHQSAGKTGTTQGSRDAWFVGYSAHLTGGVWIGADSGDRMPGVTGGSLPALIWRDIMEKAHSGLRPKTLPFTLYQGSNIAGSPRRRARKATIAVQRHHGRTPPVPQRRPPATGWQSQLANSEVVGTRSRIDDFAPHQKMGLGKLLAE